MKLLRFASPLVLCLLIGTSSSARAAMINLTYSGVNEDDSDITAKGSGNFTFAGTPTTLTKASLTSFQFNQTTTIADFGSSDFSYGLADLMSFSATVSSTGIITALSFTTDYQDASNGIVVSQYLVISSLRKNGTTFYTSGQDGDVTTGTMVAATAVPEPSSLLMCGLALGLGGLGYRRVRAIG